MGPDWPENLSSGNPDGGSEDERERKKKPKNRDGSWYLVCVDRNDQFVVRKVAKGFR